jgi:hypothetical protein
MPLFSDVPRPPTDEKGDALNKATVLQSTASIEGEMATLSVNEENELNRASSQHRANSGSPGGHDLLTNILDATNIRTQHEVKERDVIASGLSSLKTTTVNPEECAVESTCPAENSHSEDSSDDESSYFRDPRNLPRPKSDRRYSFSGSSSAADIIQSQNPASSANRELDLSLSFSEDSDEVHHHNSHHHHPQDTQQGRDLAVPELPAQSQINTKRLHNSPHNARGSDDDQSSDPSIPDELNHANRTGRFPTSVPSGRKSPVLGEHPPSRGNVALSSPSSAGLDPSPPTISSAYQQNRAYLHPQAQNLSQEELAHWLEAAYQQNTNLFEFVKRNNSVPSGSMHSNTDPSEYSADHLEGEFDDLHVQRFTDSFVHGCIPPVGAGTEQFSQRKEDRIPGVRAADSRNVNAFDSAADQQVYNEQLPEHDMGPNSEFKVYWKRWLMLMYMSVLNLLVSVGSGNFKFLFPEVHELN